jgi:hypothetical protein
MYRFNSLLVTGDNSLTGAIPSELGLLAELTVLELSESSISFSLSLLYYKILTQCIVLIRFS